MAKKKSGLTIDEHKELGKALYNMRTLTTEILLQLSKAYPNNQELFQRSEKLIDTLDDLRCTLDGQIGKDCPILPPEKFEINHIYFPGPGAHRTDK